MPFPLPLPTTSALQWSAYIRTESHPSLGVAASTHRTLVRHVLKQQRTRAADLITTAINDYLPYLAALDAGLAGRPVGAEQVTIVLEKQVAARWRSVVSRQRKVVGPGLDYELCFVLHTLALQCASRARQQLRPLFAPDGLKSDRRVEVITQSIKELLTASGIHSFAARRAADSSLPSTTDATSGVQEGLSRLAWAEATLLAILKDDPYPALVQQTRSTTDREWMYKAPDIPKVRSHLFARLAVQATEHAAQASALLQGRRADLEHYVQNLGMTARARACRFFGIEAELNGRTGEAIGWLSAGYARLNLPTPERSSAGLRKLKQAWQQRRADRKSERDSEWGLDGGMQAEARVLDLLWEQWNKQNDMMNTQSVPSTQSLLATMPSGRDICSPVTFVLPTLDASTLAELRAPCDPSAVGEDSAESSDEDESVIPGAYEPAHEDRSYY